MQKNTGRTDLNSELYLKSLNVSIPNLQNRLLDHSTIQRSVLKLFKTDISSDKDVKYDALHMNIFVLVHNMQAHA